MDNSSRTLLTEKSVTMPPLTVEKDQPWKEPIDNSKFKVLHCTLNCIICINEAN